MTAQCEMLAQKMDEAVTKLSHQCVVVWIVSTQAAPLHRYMTLRLDHISTHLLPSRRLQAEQHRSTTEIARQVKVRKL